MEKLSLMDIRNSINTAESFRSQGQYEQAVEITTPFVAGIIPDPENFEQLGNGVRIARIHTASHISLAKKEWQAEDVAKRLQNAREGLMVAQRFTQKINSLPDFEQPATEAPYAFSAEVARDKANYLVTLASLTGNAAYFDQAVAILSALSNKADEYVDPTTHPLIRFEKESLEFSSAPSPTTYFRLSDAYTDLAVSAKNMQNWGRLGAIAARFSLSSLRVLHFKGLINGLRDYDDARSKDQNVQGSLRREFGKSVLKPIREFIWRRTTPSGKQYDYLAIK